MFMSRSRSGVRGKEDNNTPGKHVTTSRPSRHLRARSLSLSLSLSLSSLYLSIYLFIYLSPLFPLCHHSSSPFPPPLLLPARGAVGGELVVAAQRTLPSTSPGRQGPRGHRQEVSQALPASRHHLPRAILLRGGRSVVVSRPRHPTRTSRRDSPA